MVKPDLDSGQHVNLRCVVSDTGDAEASQVELEASVAGGPPDRSARQSVAISGRMVFSVPIVAPRDLPFGASMDLAISVRDHRSRRAARTTIVGVMREPPLCELGELTRPQYDAKVTELRGTWASKFIIQDEFDGYDAELVSCLKSPMLRRIDGGGGAPWHCGSSLSGPGSGRPLGSEPFTWTMS